MKTISYRYLLLNNLLAVIFILSTIVFSGCGSSTKPPTTSGLKKRVLLSNPLGSAFLLPNDPFPHAGNGAVDIMDASKNAMKKQPKAAAVHVYYLFFATSSCPRVEFPSKCFASSTALLDDASVKTSGRTFPVVKTHF